MSTMKPLVLSDIRGRAGAFVANWRDAEGYEKGEAPQFAIMSSSMFIASQKAIGGRLESRLRFASTLTWYTLPLPAIEPELR